MLTFKQAHTATDTELIARYRKRGQRKWVGVLFNRYAHLVLGLCMQYLKDEDRAQDMCMAIFEKLLHELKKRQVTHFKSWLYTLSRNECLMQLRKDGNPKVLAAAEAYTRQVQESETASKALAEVQLDELQRALKQLNEAQRTCVERFYLKQQSYAAIAAETGYTLKHVKSHIQNGKRNLHNILKQHDAFHS